MRNRLIWTALTLLAVGVFAWFVYRWVAAGSFNVCVPEKLTEEATKTIEGLDKIIDLGITLSTSLVGLGAAILIGLKSGFRVSLPNQLIVLVAILFFVQSAIYAIWWRLGVAEIRLNQCFKVIAEDFLQRKFEAHFFLFILGLSALGVLVAGAVIAGPTANAEDNT